MEPYNRPTNSRIVGFPLNTDPIRYPKFGSHHTLARFLFQQKRTDLRPGKRAPPPHASKCNASWTLPEVLFRCFVCREVENKEAGWGGGAWDCRGAYCLGLPLAGEAMGLAGFLNSI